VHAAADVRRTVEIAEERAKQIVQNASDEAQRIRKDALSEMPKQWSEMVEALGLQADANHWQITDAIRALKAHQNGGPYKRALAELVRDIQNLSKYERLLSKDGDAQVQVL
jgi:hypothetical protein